MKILVCVKQVPDLESRFRIAEEGRWFQEADLAWRMNEYDEYAVEQAVRLKEQVRTADLTIVSIGPDRIRKTIKKGLALGCDRGVQIKDNDYHIRDPLQIASMIHTFAQDKNFDVIFTGMQSQDRGSGQVGLLLAEMLGMASVSTVVEFMYEDGLITVKRELEGGAMARVKMHLPALITCHLGLNTPRYPTLPNIMKAKKKELICLEVEELLTVQAHSRTAKMFVPEKRAKGIILEGEVEELAEEVMTTLQEKTTILK